jgi:hypothetical protein
MLPVQRACLACVLLWLYACAAWCQEYEIYVSDAGNFQNPPWRILKFDQSGGNPQVFTNQALAWPQDILFLEDQGIVLISNLNSGNINRHDAETGAFINTFAGGINGPTRMKIGPDGLIYVLQWNNNAPVRRYQTNGTFVDNFTSQGVNQAIGLDWDAAGDLYVSSFNGTFVRRFGPDGSDKGLFVDTNLVGPTNIWFGENGDLFVIDYSGGAVRRYDSNGNFILDFILGLVNPEGVDFFPNGDILIGNGGNGSVRQYTSNGTLLGDRIAPGSGGLMTPNAVVVRSRFYINAGLNDAWFNAATPGQGFFVTVFPDQKTMFLAWFTFDTERPDPSVMAILGDPGARWRTAYGPYDGDTAELDIELTSGGIFDSALPSPVQQPDGTITVKWSDCENALLSFDIPSASVEGDIPITRIALDNVERCEELNTPPE